MEFVLIKLTKGLKNNYAYSTTLPTQYRINIQIALSTPLNAIRECGL